MESTVRTMGPPIQLQTAAGGSARWRSWPLLDYRKWSWSVLLGIAFVSEFVLWQGGWFLAIATVAALIVAFWNFLWPVNYELTSLGIRRTAFRRMRLVPWQAIRAYQLRPTGAVLFQRANPTKFDLLSSWFVPYPNDRDELLVALRQNAAHAVELPS
jgi:hypothetical protein